MQQAILHWSKYGRCWLHDGLTEQWSLVTCRECSSSSSRALQFVHDGWLGNFQRMMLNDSSKDIHSNYHRLIMDTPDRKLGIFSLTFDYISYPFISSSPLNDFSLYAQFSGNIYQLFIVPKLSNLTVNTVTHLFRSCNSKQQDEIRFWKKKSKKRKGKMIFPGFQFLPKK